MPDLIDRLLSTSCLRKKIGCIWRLSNDRLGTLDAVIVDLEPPSVFYWKSAVVLDANADSNFGVVQNRPKINFRSTELEVRKINFANKLDKIRTWVINKVDFKLRVTSS